MTRKEQIKEAAITRFGNNGNESQYMLAKVQAFMVGARWADEHPRKVYVVMRCEEHSDYVEKVFVDNDKAVAYCNKFNHPTSDEYCRVIEEMEVTL